MVRFAKTVVRVLKTASLEKTNAFVRRDSMEANVLLVVSSFGIISTNGQGKLL